MTLRIAVGGISHETNTYCKDQTPLSEFKVERGQEIIDSDRGVRNYTGGIIDEAEKMGYTLVPTLFGNTQPSGTIARAAYDSMSNELIDLIKKALPVDAVALTLHGAGVVDGVDDLEGDLCKRVRAVVGKKIPIVVTLDLHGNVTQDMVDAVDICFGCHLYPHTDSYERGVEAIQAIPKLLSGEWKPASWVEWIPMLVVPTTTMLYPAAKVNEICAEVEKWPGVLDCTFFHGFPYTDIPQVGCMIMAAANGNLEVAKKAAKHVANWIWDHREDFRRDMLPAKEVFAEALKVDGGPVIINETADNPGAGAPGNATHVLRAMIEANLQNACFGHIYDPEVALQAHKAGVGKKIRVSLGGKYDEFHGAPLDIEVYVKSLSDGRFIQRSPLGQGGRIDLGKMARLQIGGIDILVASVRTQTLDPEAFLINGMDVTRYKIVVIKSSNHFRAGFAPIAKAIMTADSPGLSTLTLSYFPRHRTTRPIWPLDESAAYKG